MPPTTSPAAARYSHNRCIVCAEDNASVINVEDEESLSKLLNFFWEGVSVDVKPLDAPKHHFCRPCSLKVIEFYDTNEVLVQLEKHLRSVQKTLILNFTQGIEKLKAGGHPLLPVHKSVFEKWGNGFKSEDEDEGKSEQNETVSTFLEVPPQGDEEEGTSTPSKKLSPPKRAQRPTRAAARKRPNIRNDSETSSSESELPSDELDD